MGVANGIIIVVLILVAIFADQVAPYGVSEVAPQDRLTGPSAKYLLGSDQFGRDLFSRLIYGARLSLVVGLSATVLNVAVAVLIGGSSGFLGGRFDLVVQRVVDAWMAFPGLLILLAVMSLTGPGVLQIIVVLGVTGGITGSRVVRGTVIGIKGSDYFTAAQAVGTPTRVTLVRHLLPNIMATIIIIFSINVGGVVITEASLSFLGFGLPASVPSWGGMLSREGRSYMEIAPWLAIWPWARRVPDHHRLQPEHVRRRAQGPARPAAAGRKRAQGRGRACRCPWRQLRRRLMRQRARFDLCRAHGREPRHHGRHRRTPPRTRNPARLA